MSVALCLSIVPIKVFSSEKAICPKCKTECCYSDVWVSNIDTRYEQTGYILIYVKNEVTQNILTQTNNPTSLIVRNYFYDVKYGNVGTINFDYIQDPDYIEKIVNGEIYYELPITLHLRYTSTDYVSNILSDLGCKNCSDFNHVEAKAYDGTFSLVHQEEPFEIIYGLSHVSLTLKYIAGWDVDIINFIALDADKNNEINLSDIVCMMKKIAGWKNA